MNLRLILLIVLFLVPAAAGSGQSLDPTEEQFFDETQITQKAIYRHHGPALLPDPVFTPGVKGPADKQKVCTTQWGKDQRHVTQGMKRQVCELYGVKDKCPGGNYEIDHLISRELGGVDDIKNLWPQPYEPSPGARQKDEAENWLHREVCAGRIPLDIAQRKIAEDWYEVWFDKMAADHHLERKKKSPPIPLRWIRDGVVMSAFIYDVERSVRLFERCPTCYETNILYGRHPSRARFYLEGGAIHAAYLILEHKIERQYAHKWYRHLTWAPDVLFSYQHITAARHNDGLTR